MQIGGCPIGFEDGSITSYEACVDRLSLCYRFWNDLTGVLTFTGFIALHDDGALGVTISAVGQSNMSEFIARIVRYQYEVPPNDPHLVHYIFHDLDGNGVFEVVAKECHYIPPREED